VHIWPSTSSAIASVRQLKTITAEKFMLVDAGGKTRGAMLVWRLPFCGCLWVFVRPVPDARVSTRSTSTRFPTVSQPTIPY
jgi:hypothetical protein